MIKEYYLNLGEKISVFKSIDKTYTNVYTVRLRKFNGKKLYLYYPYNEIGKKRALNQANKMVKNKGWREPLSDYLSLLQQVLEVTQEGIYKGRKRLDDTLELGTDREIAEIMALLNREGLENEEVIDHYQNKILKREQDIEKFREKII